MISKSKIIIIVGPTASGKTGLSLELAKKFNGEIISADSRQVYKEMNIGTAKVAGKKSKVKSLDCGCDFSAEGIPHHLIDIINPDQDFSVADFKERAEICIQEIIKRQKVPFIVGGTGLYVWSLMDDLDIPRVLPNEKLRQELEQKPLEELITILEKMNPEVLKKIDIKNPRRLIRSIEIALSEKSESALNTVSTKKKERYDFLQLGIKISQAELYHRIDERIEEQVKQGLIEEVKKLSKKYSFDLPSMSGIGYRQIGYYLRGEMSLDEAIHRLKLDTHHYAKRQMTWFKRDQRINWLEGADLKTAEALVKRFLEE
jgi:tRNA dimethylallyltransferase